MGTIQTAVAGLQWDVASEYQTITSNLNDMISGAVGSVGSWFGSLLGGDVVGLDHTQIDAMCQAIEDYVTKIETHLNNVKATTDTSGAFKGDYAVAVTNFIEAVCYACGCVISNLREFKDNLKIVGERYVQHDQELSSEIRSQASEVESAFTKYTETN